MSSQAVRHESKEEEAQQLRWTGPKLVALGAITLAVAFAILNYISG